MSYKNGRYGLTAQDMRALNNQWHYWGLAGQGWKSFDEFLRWCVAEGYCRNCRLRKSDERLPHGPGNSYWEEPGTHIPTFPDGHPCRGCDVERAAECSRPCQARLDYWDEHMAAIRRRFGL